MSYTFSSKESSQSKPAHHEVRIALFFLGCAVFFAMVGFSYMNKKIVQELKLKDLQVNSLMTELGDLKEENLILFDNLNQNGQVVETVKDAVLGLQGRVNEVDASGGAFELQNQVELLEKELTTQQIALSRLVDEGIPSIGSDVKNILILGTHGRLTDTIIEASIDPTTERIILISLPRDLVYQGRRINAYWNQYGIEAMKKAVEEITGLYPEQYVVFDMATFEKVIETLGCVEVDVQKDLYDTLYPGPNYTYETFSLKAGHYCFDAKTALKYVRSRKSTTDFDRAARQQQIIEGVKAKILALNPLQNLDDFIALYQAIDDSVDTDVDLWQIIGYLKAYKDYEMDGNHVLSTTNYLYPITGVDGAYLLMPKGNNYDAIHDWVKSLFVP